VATEAFTGVADGTVALVTIEALSSFGGFGADWNGLLAQFPELSQRPTQVSYDAAVATARTAGQGDVTGAS
jgi:hypothetical protein